MTTVRERIGTGNWGAIIDEWNAGNLIPADEVEARIAEAVAGERERIIQWLEGQAGIELLSVAKAIRGGNHDG